VIHLGVQEDLEVQASDLVNYKFDKIIYDLLYDKVIQVGEFQNIKNEEYENWEKYEMHQKGNILEKIRVIN